MRTCLFTPFRPIIVTIIIISFLTGCNKSSTDKPDLGYGCNTTNVLETITNQPGTVVYSDVQNQWMILVNFPAGYGFGLLACKNIASLQAITAGHATTETLTVTVSGKIKYRTTGQRPLAANTTYPDIYLIDIDSITK